MVDSNKKEPLESASIAPGSIPWKSWNVDFRKRNPYSTWRFSWIGYQSPFQIAKGIVNNLDQYIRPISMNLSVWMTDNRGDSKSLKQFYLNTPKFFTEKDLENLYDNIVKSANQPDSIKIESCWMEFVAYLTFFKKKELVSEWYPSMDFYKDDLINNIDRYSLNGILSIGILGDLLFLDLFSDLWIPEFINDKLAVINDERLTAILKYIDNAVNPTDIKFFPEIGMYEHGYKKPEDSFLV